MENIRVADLGKCVSHEAVHWIGSGKSERGLEGIQVTGNTTVTYTLPPRLDHPSPHPSNLFSPYPIPPSYP